MHTVVELPGYLADARKARLTEAEQTAIADFLVRDPSAGAEIVGTGGARKVRFAGRGKGKSGGFRVITFFSGPDIPVFLLNVFAKGDKADLSKSERNALRTVLGGLVVYYRMGVKLHVRRRKTNP
ncbi:MAG: type II toxin-antitoxin system RelE/ParE family toxin [Pseudomonadota bacterium]